MVLSESFATTTPTGRRIVGELCNDEHQQRPEGVIILIHGLNSRRKNDGPQSLSALLAQKGHHVIVFDLSGSGDSAGVAWQQTLSDWIEDTLAVIAWAKHRGYRKIGLLGTSAGGNVALAVALKTPIDRIFLRAPVSDFPALLLLKHGHEGLARWKEGTLQTETLAYHFYEDAHKHVMRQAAEAITTPTLIAHGDADPEVPTQQSIELSKHLPECTLVILEGADHKLGIDGDYTKSRNLLADWFEGW